MILEQHYLEQLSHASYLLADEGSGVAAVVDPQRDVQRYLDRSEALSCQITHVILTHFHADFVAGHIELRERTGAEIHLGARARAEYPFTPMVEGSTLRVGDVGLDPLETPGHSPESISIVVRGDGGDAPNAVLTGDTLFIGDVGRPDLRAEEGWSAEELATMLYDSLHGKLLQLPDETLVYPCHGAGSLCGRSLSSETISTLGAQRLHNYALQPMSREAFVELVIADQPQAPAYFAYDAALNTRERPTLEAVLERALLPLTHEQALARTRAGAQLLDARDPERFAEGHIAGSVNVGLEGSFETCCGSVLEPTRAITLVTDPGRETEAATRLGRIGFDGVDGFLAGGIASLDGAARSLERIEWVTPTALAERLRRNESLELLDVRTRSEFEHQRIEGAVNVPLAELPARIGSLARDRPVIVYCEAGYRSSVAISLMRREGIEAVSNLAGGFAAWCAATAVPTAQP